MHKTFRHPKFFETLNAPPPRDAPPPTMHQNFRYQNFLETQKGSPTNFFGTVRQKKSTENSDIPFLCIKFFDTRNFLKHRSVPQRNFLVLRRKVLNEVFCI